MSSSSPQSLGEGKREAPISYFTEEGLSQPHVFQGPPLPLLSPCVAPDCFPTVVSKGVTQHLQHQFSHL